MSGRGGSFLNRCEANAFELPLYGVDVSAERGPGSPRPGGPTGGGAERRWSRAGTRGGTSESQKVAVCGMATGLPV